MSKTSMSWKSIWIYLKSQIEFWNLKIEFKSENFLSLLKFYFKHGPRGVVQCACIQPYRMINLKTCGWHRSSGFMFEIYFQTGQTFFRFRLNFQISKLDLGFQINSNGFSRDRSFGHYLPISSLFWCQRLAMTAAEPEPHGDRSNIDE